MKLWRLLLECGHLRISGPWDDGDMADDKHMVGDLTWCEVCPMIVVQHHGRGLPEMRVWEVVGVDRLPPENYREPNSGLTDVRSDQIQEGRP